MPSLNKGKHIIAEIEGIRCSVAESGANKERADFLRKLLEFNNYTVKIQEEAKKDPGNPTTYIIGVTDILFNPVIDIYKRRLHSLNGYKVTPSYWLQTSDIESEAEVNYWTLRE